MTTSNEITLDHINAYFDLRLEPEAIDVAPTATGGAGINNENQYPLPVPTFPLWRRSGTEYVKKYTEKDKDNQLFRSLAPSISAGSTTSLFDVEDSSTVVGTLPALNELDDEVTQNIYSTYFNLPNRTYDSDLSISSYREEILQQLNISPVVIIQGPTGCGKTTQVPQYILDYHQSRGTYCNIIVTQPRKIAAISIAKRVCQERKWQLGTIVGYQVAMDPKTSTDTRLCYVTTGVLLEKLVNAKRMDMYTHVIIDEVHERNQDIDFALLLVKKFLNTNSQRVKVILMSATFDSTEFANYFSLSSRGDAAPIIEIYGKSKDVTEHYLAELKELFKHGEVPTSFEMSRPYIHKSLYDCVVNLMIIFDKMDRAEQRTPEGNFAPKRGAVLIFLPGYEEISAMSNKLQARSFELNYWIIPLHSSITVEEQTKVFRDAPRDHRKIILSTNIAESSITVPDIKYVIDFCLTKSLVTDPATNYTCLQLEWASKANCIQRKGRTGRVDIGKCYRMVDRNFYDQLPDYSIPEIKRCPLTRTILHLKKLNLCEPQEMLAFALDPPDLSDIGHAVLQLKESLALTSKGTNPFDGDLTFIGRVMASLPLDIKLTKLIIFGYAFHCLEECIIMAASLSLQSFFLRPFSRSLDAYRSRLSWADGTFSDCLAHLNAYNVWRQLTVQSHFSKPGGLNEPDWAHLNFIELKRIRDVDMLVKEIKKRLEKLQIYVDQRHRPENQESNTLILKMIIAGAFFPNYFLQEQLDEKKINREINENDPLTTVKVTGLPKHGILYASALKDLFSRCSENMNIEFEESRAYIQFQRSERSTSTVIYPVYLACKMRELRLVKDLVAFSEEEAERKSKQLMASKSEVNGGRLVSNRITVKLDKGSKIEKIPLPTLDRNVVSIFVTHVVDCGHFWARYVTPRHDALLEFLETTINSDRGRNLQPLSKVPQINMLYLAPYIDSLYYRAQLLEIKEDKAKVFFVDYGNTEIIELHELREIDESTPDVFTTPALAFECYLAEIKPSSIKSSDGNWCKEANEWLKKTVNGVVLKAKIYSVVQDTVRCTLIKRERDGTNLFINQGLIHKGYAENAEESLLSKQNNELRANHCMLDDPVENVPRDIEVSWKEASEYITLATTSNMIRLHGPSNPLEVSYSGLTYLDRSKCVRIEQDSVNSISFNAEPQDPYTSMLVASHIGVGQNNFELIARSTTLMPKLRGLPSLVCLLFSPFAEIRTDRANKSYIGALCGLGFEPETGQAIYADHDIEITFDIELTLEDINQINSIRMGFNLLLSSNSDTLEYLNSSVALIHEKTRREIVKLLQKHRNPKEPEYFRKPCQWNQIKGKQLEPCAEPNADCPSVLPLHRLPVLMKSSRKEMKKHLDELYEIAHRPKGPINIKCQLCSLEVKSSRDLLCHLDSEKHRRKEENWRQGIL